MVGFNQYYWENSSKVSQTNSKNFSSPGLLWSELKVES